MRAERASHRRGGSTALAAVMAALAGATACLGGTALAGAASASAAEAASAASSGATVDVTATGSVVGTPNTLTLTIGVETVAASAAAALDRNDAEMSALQATLFKAGVSKNDVATSNLSISPDYRNNGTISGYDVSDNLTVTLSDLATAGSVIDTAAHAVGNDIRIQGITFSISNTSHLLAEARIQAVRNARTEALDLAAGAGATLGPVEKIIDEEQQQTSPPPPVLTPRAVAVPLQAGTETVSVQVEVIYGLS